MKNGLSQFINRAKEEESKNKVLIIDGHNMIFRNVFVANNIDPLDLDFRYWKSLIFSNIFNMIEMFNPNEIIIALDAKRSWRKDVYPDYKANRKTSRDDSVIDFEKFFPISNQFFEELKDILQNVKFIKIDECEADDIIAVLTRDVLKDSNVVAITNDKDMYQLYKTGRYSQYDPIKKKIIKVLNPQQELDLKIIMGDKSDNIPAIKKKCGIKTAEKILDSGIENELINEEVNKNYLRNKELIDFDCIPLKIKKTIIKHYEEYQTHKYESTKVFNFLMKNKLGNMVEDIQKYNNLMKSID